MALPKGTQFAMAPTAPKLRLRDINSLIKAQIVEAGFGGLHVPLEWEFNDAVVELQRRADAEGWHILYWLRNLSTTLRRLPASN